MANKYVRIARELGKTELKFGFDTLTIDTLYKLASAPEEVKEDVANSKDKEEAEKKIKEYEELGHDMTPILNNLSLNKLYTLASAPEEVKEELGTTNSRVFDDLDFFTL